MTAPEQHVDDTPVETPADPTPEAPEAEPETPDWVKEKIAKANREAQNLRARLKEQEPLVKAAQEAEEAQKTEIQRAMERAEAAEQRAQQYESDNARLRTAAKYGIGEDYFEFLGSGSAEEMEERAAKLGLLLQSAKGDAEPTRPPSERPLESLKPGASPGRQPATDNSYPPDFLPGMKRHNKF